MAQHSYSTSYDDEVPQTARLHPYPPGTQQRPAFQHQHSDSGWSDHAGPANPFRDQPSPQPQHRDYAGASATYATGGLNTPAYNTPGFRAGSPQPGYTGGYTGGATPYQSQDDFTRYSAYGASRADLSAGSVSTDALGSYGAAGTTGGAYGGTRPAWAATAASREKAKKKKTRLIWILVVAILAVVIIAVIILYLTVFKKKSNNNAAASSSSGKANSTTASVLIVGRNGATVTMEDGTNFTYTNSFGGYFIVDNTNPYNDGAKPNSWTPALNETWDYATDRMFGVNLGGWLVPEPFIAPALYEKYDGVFTGLNGDEWTLSQAMANDTAGGGLAQMETHYKTFITEQDFAEIAGAGLNWVRLPVPFNAFGTLEGEPFLANVSWTYVLKAFQWGRKYGIRINLDLHTMPGSQNGLNHSGKLGFVAWMSSVMGLANVERSMSFVRSVAEFISQPEYKNVVPLLGVVNEPQGQDWTTVPKTMYAFYLESYKQIREITGVGEGNGPWLTIHDHFEPLSNWATFLTGADRIIMDTHPYFTFDGQSHPNISGFPPKPCTTFGTPLNQSLNTFGLTIAGEWSLGFNDCGQYVWGLDKAPNTVGCDELWNDYTAYSADTKAQLMQLAMAHMDALWNWFFWTWKVGVSNKSPQGGTLVGAPLWSYQLGLQEGWLPTDPRTAAGECVRLGVVPTPEQYYVGTLSSWQTGGAGAGTIATTATSDGINTWPPVALATISALPVPTYTATGTVPVLPTPTWNINGFKDTADGWYNSSDTAPGVVPIANCKYPDPWNPGGSPPNPLCQ